MSLREIAKAQGKPANSSEFPDSTYHEYKWGTITTGKDGVKSIMLFARKPS
jgi:hypothetical protein